MYNPKAHLKRMVDVHAPSGYEVPVAELLRREWTELVDEFESDRLGSLIGIKRGTAPSKSARKIMLAAHMDEIALMVREIKDGFLFVHRIAGIDPRVMLAQTVLVHGIRVLPGVVATMPPHMLTAADRKQYLPIDALVVDVGLPAAEVEELVAVGDLVTMEGPMIDLKGRQAASKAMDDRSCIATMTACLGNAAQDEPQLGCLRRRHRAGGGRLGAARPPPPIISALIAPSLWMWVSPSSPV